jgi:DNA-binding HxlR family transcriptional regulator
LNDREVQLMETDMKWCPIDTTFKLIGKKFTLHILRNIIILKQTRFNQMIESIEGINTKTLATRLKEMERNGLISRKSYNEIPPRVEYSVTDKGRALECILEQMAAFSMYFYPEDVFEDKIPRTFKEFFGRCTTRLK